MKRKVDLLNLISYVASNRLFKSDFDGVKSKVGLWLTQLIQSILLMNLIYQTKFTNPNLLNQTCILGAIEPKLDIPSKRFKM